VLAARGIIDYPVFVFANTGDDSEHPDTLEYVRNVAMPYARTKGIEFVETQKRRLGKHERQTLLRAIYERQRSIPIPIYMSGGGPGNRACTIDFKIKVIDKWIAENGGRDAGLVTLGLGITTDEIQRARVHEIEKVRGFMKAIEYPLIDLHINRSRCQRIIQDEGLPMPPRSACWFCPFHSRVEWTRLRSERPDLFERAVELENFINHKRTVIMGKDEVYLHPSCRPLDEAVGLQMSFSKWDLCESGYCMA